jgi:uncharacterized protein YbjT (DUF2867 family)
MIFVAGATGNVGGQIVRILADAGDDVGGLVREGRQSVLPPGVRPVVGDLNRPETFSGALGRVDAAFLLSGYEHQEQTLQALRDAGAERIVLLSSSSVPGGELDNAVTRYHTESEAAVEASGLAWTHLRPSSFMTNTLQLAAQLAAGDLVREPFADVPIAVIDPFDVGSVAARALRSSDYEGRALRLTGPEALRPADRVRVLGTILGRELRFEPKSNDEARAEMEAAMPPEYVDAFFRFFVDGTLDESIVLPTVAEVTGRPARTFEQWATDNAGAFPAPRGTE